MFVFSGSLALLDAATAARSAFAEKVEPARQQNAFRPQSAAGSSGSQHISQGRFELDMAFCLKHIAVARCNGATEARDRTAGAYLPNWMNFSSASLRQRISDL